MERDTTIVPVTSDEDVKWGRDLLDESADTPNVTDEQAELGTRSPRLKIYRNNKNTNDSTLKCPSLNEKSFLCFFQVVERSLPVIFVPRVSSSFPMPGSCSSTLRTLMAFEYIWSQTLRAQP